MVVVDRTEDKKITYCLETSKNILSKSGCLVKAPPPPPPQGRGEALDQQTNKQKKKKRQDGTTGATAVVVGISCFTFRGMECAGAHEL